MDFYVGRAMQIAGMSLQQIDDLHAIERERGYCLPNWNIQEVFHLTPIRTHWCIPDDGALQEIHAARVRQNLLSQKVAIDESEERVNNDGQKMVIHLKPWEAVTTGRVESVHRYDARVHDAVSTGKISFAFEGGPSSGGTRLRDRVGSGRRSVDRVFND